MFMEINKSESESESTVSNTFSEVRDIFSRARFSSEKKVACRHGSLKYTF